MPVGFSTEGLVPCRGPGLTTKSIVTRANTPARAQATGRQRGEGSRPVGKSISEKNIKDHMTKTVQFCDQANHTPSDRAPGRVASA
jgi:hypothetical protein